jgi:hypothetical protein
MGFSNGVWASVMTPGFSNDAWASKMPSEIQQWHLGFCNGIHMLP